MLTRKLREELNELSLFIYGTSSKWEKLLKDRNFRMIDGQKEVDTPDYKHANVSHSSKPIVKTGTSVKTVNTYVKPTFEQLKTILVKTAKDLKMARLDKSDLIKILSYEASVGKLEHTLKLQVKEENKVVLDNLLNSLSEDLRNKLENLLKPTERGLELDAIEFANHYVFCVTSPAVAEIQYKELSATLEVLGVA